MLARLEPLAGPLERYAGFHAARGALLAETGDISGARAAFDIAASLAGTDTERAHVLKKLADL